MCRLLEEVHRACYVKLSGATVYYDQLLVLSVSETIFLFAPWPPLIFHSRHEKETPFLAVFKHESYQTCQANIL